MAKDGVERTNAREKGDKWLTAERNLALEQTKVIDKIYKEAALDVETKHKKKKNCYKLPSEIKLLTRNKKYYNRPLSRQKQNDS